MLHYCLTLVVVTWRLVQMHGRINKWFAKRISWSFAGSQNQTGSGNVAIGQLCWLWNQRRNVSIGATIYWVW